MSLGVLASFVAGAASAKLARWWSDRPLPLPRAPDPRRIKPTICLVHGAFVNSSCWFPVIRCLQREGYVVVALPNPLRGVEHDTLYLDKFLSQIEGLVVLVAHGYGGFLTTNSRHDRIKALVFIAAYAPQLDETLWQLHDRHVSEKQMMRSTLKKTEGTLQEVTIQTELFGDMMCTEEAAVMAVAQKPIVSSALEENIQRCRWRHTPSFYMMGGADHLIGVTLARFMGVRMDAVHAMELPGASHLPMLTHDRDVAQLILTAALY